MPRMDRGRPRESFHRRAVMFGLILLLAVFTCIASVFYPGLRKLAKAILLTAFLSAFGVWVLLEIMISK
jgi:hypothetical protein